MQATLGILKREIKAYFMNPLGYVFILFFVFIVGYFAFQNEFFANNEANLRLLTTFFPLISALFIPTITMSMWAEEKKMGTEELLFTLPANDLNIVLGKFFAATFIYTLAMIFLFFAHFVVLSSLGDPAMSEVFSQYLAFWLSGIALISVGMVASSLSSSMVVAFILGLIFCSAFTFTAPGLWISDLVGVIVISLVITFAARFFTSESNTLMIIFGASLALMFFLWQGIHVPFHLFFGYLGFGLYFSELIDGIISLQSVLYFLFITVIMLYLNSIILSRRNW